MKYAGEYNCDNCGRFSWQFIDRNLPNGDFDSRAYRCDELFKNVANFDYNQITGKYVIDLRCPSCNKKYFAECERRYI